LTGVVLRQTQWAARGSVAKILLRTRKSGCEKCEDSTAWGKGEGEPTDGLSGDGRLFAHGPKKAIPMQRDSLVL
jgi:hypothetical protein